MKKIIYRFIVLIGLFPMALLQSCDFLDVVPPEQADLDDSMRDADAVLRFLYGCYGEIPYLPRVDYLCDTDERAEPQILNSFGQTIAYNQLNSSTVWKNNDEAWKGTYRAIGYVNLFRKQLSESEPLGVTPEMKQEYLAECKFIVAFMHYRILEQYGPCPVIDWFLPTDTPKNEIPGRSHFDYVVDFICRYLDEAAAELPATRIADEWSRATSTMCYAVKSRVLLLAASELWNGGFPYKDWKNKVETPGYGYELVSKHYDRQKWEDALSAADAAIKFAETEGKNKLMTIDNLPTRVKDLKNLYIPGKEGDETFQKHVKLMGMLFNSLPSEGNEEYIMGFRWNNNIQGDFRAGIPRTIIKQNNSWVSGYSLTAPTLYTIEHFYTENGTIPGYDDNWYDKDEWFESAGVAGRPDITKLCTGREPRFYAWMGFDGGDYLSMAVNGNPLTLDMKSSALQGYSPSANRNYSVTGFLGKKWVNPDLKFTNNNGSTGSHVSYVVPYIRLAELYLNRAECYAELGQTDKSLDDLNVIRNRAGVPELTEEMIAESGLTLIDWVRNERFIELWGEGIRRWDLRRWKTAPQQLKAGAREGLNVETKYDPTFEEFNVRTKINQPFQWNDRMYLYPIYIDELYSNPQMVQAPGY
jgi:hypothetical protein